MIEIAKPKTLIWYSKESIEQIRRHRDFVRYERAWEIKLWNDGPMDFWVGALTRQMPPRKDDEQFGGVSVSWTIENGALVVEGRGPRPTLAEGIIFDAMWKRWGELFGKPPYSFVNVSKGGQRRRFKFGGGL